MSLGESLLETDVARRTQGRILDAANREIAKVGYKKLRMDGVARGSGITRQTIYNYFPNKAQLVTAVLLREGSLVNARAKQRLGDDADGAAALTAAMTALIDTARASAIFVGMFEEGSIQYINDIAEHSMAIGGMMHDYWGPVLDRLAADGTLRTDQTRDRVEWWLSHLYRSMLFRPAADLDNRVELDRLIRDFVVPSVLIRPS